MGDILHALPAVTALRLAHPGWEIDWVVEPRWRALLAAQWSDRPRACAADRRSALLCAHQGMAQGPFSGKTPRNQWLCAAQLGRPLDAVIDMQGAVRSAVVGRMAGCPRLIGEAKPREAAARLLFTERVATSGAHVIEQDVELASAVAGDTLIRVPPGCRSTRPLRPGATHSLLPAVPGPCTHQSWSGMGRQAMAGGALRSRCMWFDGARASAFWSMPGPAKSRWPTSL